MGVPSSDGAPRPSRCGCWLLMAHSRPLVLRGDTGLCVSCLGGYAGSWTQPVTAGDSRMSR